MPFSRELMILLCLLLYGCGVCTLSNAEEYLAKSSGPIEIVCHYGVGGINQLNTEKGTFTHDMVIDPAIVIPLELSAVERSQILNFAIAEGFFSLPPVISSPTNSTLNLQIGLCSNYYLSIKSPVNFNKVSLYDCSRGQLEEGRKVARIVALIKSIIAKKPEYKSLPVPRAGYQ